MSLGNLLAGWLGELSGLFKFFLESRLNLFSLQPWIFGLRGRKMLPSVTFGK
jgi:hypothetical protein